MRVSRVDGEILEVNRGDVMKVEWFAVLDEAEAPGRLFVPMIIVGIWLSELNGAKRGNIILPK